MWKAFMIWRRRRLLERRAIPDERWLAAIARQPLAATLTDGELDRLREPVTLFLAEKRFLGAHGFTVTQAMQAEIALLACLPILNLGIEWYDGWTTVIVYPDEFYPRHEVVDEDGVVHVDEAAWTGEAQEGGPVVLSWAGIEAERNGGPGSLVIHEFAHQLDMRDGLANGRPPLHAGMDGETWRRVFTAAWDDLHERERRGEEPPIDPYAASDPAEFFAVACEWFFTAPAQLRAAWPAVHEQLALFFRRDPLAFQAENIGQD